jgi:hypothetical protein
MTMDRETAISKIKLLLKKAEHNGNQGEFEACMLLVQRIMVEHDLDMSEVELVQVADEGVVNTRAYDPKRRNKWWYFTLASILADNYRCYSYRNHGETGITVNFIGKKSDVEIVSAVFNFAMQYLANLALEYAKSCGYSGRDDAPKNTYIQGFLAGLREKFNEQKQSNQSWLPVLAKSQDVNKLHDDLELRSSRSTFKVSRDQSIYDAGFVKGREYVPAVGAVGNRS